MAKGVPEIVQRANRVAATCLEAREQMRWHQKIGPARDKRIEALIAKLNSAMVPVRAQIGRIPYRDDMPEWQADDLRAASARCQYERRQLKKMLTKNARKGDD